MIVNKFETEDGVIIFRLNGKLIDSSLESPKSGIDSAFDEGHLWLVVNGEGLNVVDQAGAGFLLSRIRQARKRGGELLLSGLGSAILALLGESDPTLEVQADEEAAIAELRVRRKKSAST